jgi:pimeloyl-ACP methyl ester carboxylesterase
MKNHRPRPFRLQHLLASTLAFTLTAAAPAHAAAPTPASISDAALLKRLPGFQHAYADVNGIRLHYVIGGEGAPLVLLPGWPETWWGYHKIMPELARHYRVIVVDLRGMGGSSRPEAGYDKKTMAADVQALVTQLGYKSAHIAGHDIGSQVAYSYAANFPQSTRKLVMMDVGPPTESMLALPLLPAHGSFGDKMDPAHPYFWWFAFHQVKGLPEKILAGRVRLEQEWFYTYMLKDEHAIDAHDRAVYEKAYNNADAIRASNGWYQAFTQDIIDDKTYAPLAMPVLGLGGIGHERLKAVMERKANNFTAVRIENSGHFVQEEQPTQVIRAMLDFLGAPGDRD